MNQLFNPTDVEILKAIVSYAKNNIDAIEDAADISINDSQLDELEEKIYDIRF
jgi:hypothetical protein